MTPRVHSLHIYPIKSCHEVRLFEAEVTSLGLRVGDIDDRRWAIINEAGVCLTQRQYPQLARVQIDLLRNHNGWANGIMVSAENMPVLKLYPDEQHEAVPTVKHFSRRFPGHLAAPEAHEWFSAFLKMPVKLLRQGDLDIRPTDANFSHNPGKDQVSYADGFPILVTNVMTLNKLNLLAGHPFSMRRFRPNIVIDNTPAEIEYKWDMIGISQASLALVKPCTRCIMTTVDQSSGVMTGDELLEILKRTSVVDIGEGNARVRGPGFGQNAIPYEMGTIRLNDPVRIIAYTPDRNIFARTLELA